MVHEGAAGDAGRPRRTKTSTPAPRALAPHVGERSGQRLPAADVVPDLGKGPSPLRVGQVASCQAASTGGAWRTGHTRLTWWDAPIAEGS